jgi:hypothetical protein
MTAFYKNIVIGLLTAAVIGQFTFIWNVNARLSVVETKLDFLTTNKHLVDNYEH